MYFWLQLELCRNSRQPLENFLEQFAPLPSYSSREIRRPKDVLSLRRVASNWGLLLSRECRRLSIMGTNVSVKIMVKKTWVLWVFFFEVCIIILFRGSYIIILTSFFVYEESLQNLSNIVAFTRREKHIWIFLTQAMLL